MTKHPQVWVKVNSVVDEKLAEMVSVLNAIPKLQTVDSCQGEPDKEQGHVYFFFGGWQVVGRFVFTELAPLLQEYLGEDVQLEVHATSGREPLGLLKFSTEAIPKVTAALRSVGRKVYELRV